MASRPLTEDDPRHGTYAGWSAHRRAKSTPCEACRGAHNAWLRDQREGNPTSNYPSQGRWSKANGKALRRLGREYPDRLRELRDEELAKDGT